MGWPPGFGRKPRTQFYTAEGFLISASTSGAVKSLIESLGLSVSVYRDRAPEKTPLPYVTVSEAIAVVPDKLEDGAASTGKETISVDVWQMWKNKTTGAIAESYSLPGAILRGIQGKSLGSTPTRGYVVLVQRLGPRLVEEEENITHVPITAVVWRVL